MHVCIDTRNLNRSIDKILTATVAVCLLVTKGGVGTGPVSVVLIAIWADNDGFRCASPALLNFGRLSEYLTDVDAPWCNAGRGVGLLLLWVVLLLLMCSNVADAVVVGVMLTGVKRAPRLEEPRLLGVPMDMERGKFVEDCRLTIAFALSFSWPRFSANITCQCCSSQMFDSFHTAFTDVDYLVLWTSQSDAYTDQPMVTPSVCWSVCWSECDTVAKHVL